MTRSRDIPERLNRKRVFFDPTELASWNIDEDTNILTCWGRLSGAQTGIITFGKFFLNPPFTVVTASTTVTGMDAGDLRFGSGSAQGLNGLQQVRYSIVEVTTIPVGAVEPVSGEITYISIGDWDGVS